MPRLVVIAALLGTLAVLVPVLGPIMHDNDQASLLYGAARLARGAESPWAADFYNYDKQYASYWLMAALRSWFPNRDFVALGNVISFSVFWSGVLAVMLRGRIRRLSQALAAVACLLAPSVWLHSPFLGTSSLSAGCFLLAWSLWPGPGGSLARRIATVLLLMLAVGSRADALLVLPWLVWTATPAKSLGRLLTNPLPYAAAGAGLLALLLGRAIFTGATVDGYPPFFRPKIYAAYLVFGMGAGAAVLLWVTFNLLAIARRRRGQRRATGLFYIAGFAALLLPWAFYSAQLFTTRYWTPVLMALLIGIVSRRGRALVAASRRPLLARAGAAALLTATLAPTVAGIHLPTPTRPALVASEPTLFPTGDGLQPMGAMIWFLRRIATAPDHVVDHNQGIWVAASRAPLRPGPTGCVPILDSPLSSYLRLAVELAGRESCIVKMDAPAFYADARDLLRVYATPYRFQTTDPLGDSAQLNIRRTGAEVAGHAIVRHDRDQPQDPEWVEGVAIARALDGNAYRALDAYRGQREFTLPRREQGKSVVLYSREPFSAALAFAGQPRRPLVVRRLEQPRIHVAVIDGPDWHDASFVILQGEPSVAVSVHPSYMSIRKL